MKYTTIICLTAITVVAAFTNNFDNAVFLWFAYGLYKIFKD